jgi:accessory gene regulator B
MIHALAKKACKAFLNKPFMVDKRDRDAVYTYALELLISHFCSFMTILLIAALCHIIRPTFIFLLFYVPLRAKTGGYHASSYLLCYITTVIVYTAAILFLFYVLPLLSTASNCLIFVLCAVYILYRAPIINSHHPLSTQQISNAKVAIKFLLVIDLIISLLCAMNGWSSFLSIITVSLLTDAVLMIISSRKEGLW